MNQFMCKQLNGAMVLGFKASCDRIFHTPCSKTNLFPTGNSCSIKNIKGGSPGIAQEVRISRLNLVTKAGELSFVDVMVLCFTRFNWHDRP
jgi:hypothetical protein